MATSFFYIYVMATSFFYIYIDIYFDIYIAIAIDIDIKIDIEIDIEIDIYKLTERPVVLLNAIFYLSLLRLCCVLEILFVIFSVK